VNEESLATPQTGSLTNPFTSIAQAYSALGAITCDLALLGSSASISTTIALKTGSSYTIRSVFLNVFNIQSIFIRPDASFTSTYFPLYLHPGATIQTTSASLMLQKLQFVELNPSRSISSSLFKAYTSSTLTFQVPVPSIIFFILTLSLVCTGSRFENNQHLLLLL